MNNSLLYMNENIINYNFKSTKNNLGIQILRFLLCFWVVIMHCSYVKKEHKKYLSKGFHVPTFFLISFFFYYPNIYNKNIDKIISRFQRLLLPYIFWPLIALIFQKNNDHEHVLRNILSQILIGAPIHGIFWFQFNLIFLSLFFAIILFVFNTYGSKILAFLGLFCYYLHLSSLIYKLLINYSFAFKNNIGSLLEVMPLSVNGCFLNSINLLFIARKFSIYFYFILLLILFKYDIFINRPGFRYSNISLNIISSSILFILFGALPIEKIKKNNYIILVIKYLTQFTGGIYYSHIIVRDFLQRYSFSFLKRNYTDSLIIYIICFSICFFGNKLFKNSKIKYLFL